MVNMQRMAVFTLNSASRTFDDRHPSSTWTLCGD